MPANTYADIAAYIGTIFEDAMLMARDNNIIAGLVQTFDDQSGDANRTNSRYGTATMSHVAETDDLATQSFTPSPYMTLTVGEVAAQFFLTDRRIDNDPFGAQSDARTELGMAMASQIESDVLSDFANLTGGTVGVAGSVMTWGQVFAAETLLRQNLTPGPYAMVISPFQWYSLGTVPTIVGAQARNAPDFQNESMRNFWIAGVGMVDIYVTANIAAGTAALGAMFGRDAIALDRRRAPRLEPERDASRRGWELNLSAVYGHGVWHPEHGVKMIGSGVAPTGA